MMTMAKYIRWTAAGLLVMHGGIDALGFFSAWDLAKIEEIGGPSFLLDSLEAGHPAIIAFGLLWLVAMVGFMTAGIGAALDTAWWLSLAGIAAGVGLLPTIVWWNDAWIGAVVNFCILAVVVLGRSRIERLHHQDLIGA
jgi:hypothetical protein